MSKAEAGLTKQQAAQFLGISERQLRRYVEKGMPRTGTGSQARFGPDSFAWHREYSATLNPAGRLAGDLTAEQARKTKIDADRAELKLRKEQNELVPMQTVLEWQQKANGFIADRLLAFPRRITPVLFRLKTIPQMKEALTDGIYALLTDLSKGIPPNYSKERKR